MTAESKIRPLFSVIVPTFNRRELLERAVDSVLSQSCEDYELIVINDGSTDDTAAWLSSLDHPRLQVQHQENLGRNVARNAGARAATGEYFLFFDSDDAVDTDWLERLNACMLEHEPRTVDLVSCGARWLDERGELIHETFPTPRGRVFGDLPMQIRAGMFAIRGTRFFELGAFYDDLELFEHTELAMRIARAAEAQDWLIASTHEVLVTIHYCGHSVASASADVPQVIERIIEMHWEALLRDPEKLVQYYNIAGVNSARVRRFRDARGYFAKSLDTNWFQPRTLLRLACCYLPWLRQLAWRPSS